MSGVKGILARDKPLQLIDPNPRIAKLLEKRKAIVLPDRLYNWATDWVNEVGTIVRSRSFIASNLAYGLIGVGKLAIFGQKK